MGSRIQTIAERRTESIDTTETIRAIGIAAVSSGHPFSLGISVDLVPFASTSRRQPRW